MDFSHRLLQKESCEWQYGKMCCTTIQLGVTTEPIEFVMSDAKHRKYVSKHLLTTFILSISLGMIGGVEMQLGSLESEQFLPKIVGESWISVRDNRMRHAMEFEYIIHKKLSHYGCGERVLKST
jgi:hypothetical protein